MQSVAWEFFENCKERIENVFNTWLEKHPTQDANSWADMVISELEESDNNYVASALENGIHWGSVFMSPQEIKQYVNKQQVWKFFSDDFNESMEPYEYQIEEYLNDNKPGWEESGESWEDYVSENNLEEVVKEYVFDNTDLQDFVSTLRADLQEYVIDLHRAIAEKLYRYYMANWSNELNRVHEDIQVAIERMNGLDRNSDVGLLTEAISLAVGVMHANGNILEDYGYGDISLKYIDLLDSGLPEQAEWQEELREEFGIHALKEEGVSALQAFR
jgi:hypothetical protein